MGGSPALRDPEPEESHGDWSPALSHGPPPGGKGTAALAMEAHVGPDLPRRTSSHGGRGGRPGTHSAGRPGRRSRGRSGRCRWRVRTCRCSGKSTPGGRRHRSDREGRLRRELAGRSPAAEEQGSRRTPGTSLTLTTSGGLTHPPQRPRALLGGPERPPPQPGLGLPTHPARSAAPSSPGRRSSCRRPRGTGPRSCRRTRPHSPRRTGSEGSLGAEVGHHSELRDWTHSGDMSPPPSLHKHFLGPVSAHVRRGADGSRILPTHPSSPQMPGPAEHRGGAGSACPAGRSWSGQPSWRWWPPHRPILQAEEARLLGSPMAPVIIWPTAAVGPRT